MKREYIKIVRGTDTKHRVTIIDEIVDPMAKADRRFKFLQTLANDGPYSGILACGPIQFESMQVFHDGFSWVAVLEATEYVDQ